MEQWKFLWLLTLGAVGFSSSAVALDFGPKLGVLQGTISNAEANDGKANALGGMIIGADFYNDYSSSFTGFAEPQFLIDLDGVSVLRKGVGLGILWHLLGGPRDVVDNGFWGAMRISTTYNLSVLFRTGYYAYTARDLTNQSEPVEGSAIENFVGLNLGLNIFEGVSMGAEVGAAVINFAASIERLNATSIEASFFLRFTI